MAREPKYKLCKNPKCNNLFETKQAMQYCCDICRRSTYRKQIKCLTCDNTFFPKQAQRYCCPDCRPKRKIEEAE